MLSLAHLHPRISNFHELLSFPSPQCYYPFLVRSFLEDLKFDLSIQLLGEIVLNCGNTILFSYFLWVGRTYVSITAGSQENHCLHPQVSEEAGDGDSVRWCVCMGVLLREKLKSTLLSHCTVQELCRCLLSRGRINSNGG